MHISFKIIKNFNLLLFSSTCFGHHCVHHQELLIASHAVSGHRVVLVLMFPSQQGWRKQPTQHRKNYINEKFK
jgi:hypothetical protein